MIEVSSPFGVRSGSEQPDPLSSAGGPASSAGNSEYRSPEVRALGDLDRLQGNYSGKVYDGPSQYYFDGF